MAAEAAQEIILGDAELRVLANFLTLVLGHAVEEMRRTLGEILRIDPARADQRPIDMMLDHALERPGLGALLQAERRIEIEAVFALDMGADEGGVGNALRFVLDIG